MTALRLVAAATGLALSLSSPGAASGTPGRGVDSNDLNQNSSGGVDYITREITIAPGGSTGWHWHDGKLIGVLKQGTLTHNMSDCHVDGVYDVGDPIIEDAGADHVHIGRNLGDVPLILQVMYVDPVGRPLSEDAPNPGCPFS